MGPRRHDLADQEPEKLQELIQLWWAQAGQYGALPLENRGALEILTTDRPQLTKPRNRYVYYPGTAEVPESVAPNIRNRSYTVAAAATRDSIHAVVLDCETIPFVDITAARMLNELNLDLARRGVRLVIARDIGQVRDMLALTGQPDHAHEYYRTVQAAVESIGRHAGSRPEED